MSYNCIPAKRIDERQQQTQMKEVKKEKKNSSKIGGMRRIDFIISFDAEFFFSFYFSSLTFSTHNDLSLSLSLSQSFRFYIKVVTRCRQRRRISAECARAASLWHRTVSVDRAFGALVLFFSTFCNHSSFTLTQLHTRSAKPSLSLSLSFQRDLCCRPIKLCNTKNSFNIIFIVCYSACIGVCLFILARCVVAFAQHNIV